MFHVTRNDSGTVVMITDDAGDVKDWIGDDTDYYSVTIVDQTFAARWWHKSGFWTTGTFHAPSVQHVHDSIGRSGGSDATVIPVV